MAIKDFICEGVRKVIGTIWYCVLMVLYYGLLLIRGICYATKAHLLAIAFLIMLVELMFSEISVFTRYSMGLAASAFGLNFLLQYVCENLAIYAARVLHETWNY